MMKWFWGKLKRGDRVEVLPLEEIVKTLDEQGRSEGLKFVKGMERLCGKQFRVLKKEALGSGLRYCDLLSSRGRTKLST